MFRTHIARHLAAPLEVTPGREHRDHAIGLILPDESIWAIRSLFTHGRCIEDDFNWLIEEVKRNKVCHEEFNNILSKLYVINAAIIPADHHTMTRAVCLLENRSNQIPGCGINLSKVRFEESLAELKRYLNNFPI